ncbi:MAG: deoxyribose-phosphate aldolase [Bacteroidota bacterium]
MNEVQELAKMIDHSLLHPTMTDDDLVKGCAIAKEYDVASVCIKPYAIDLAVKALEGSSVLVGTVIGFPHGNSSTEVKVAETIAACKAGATEIDMVINIGKALAGEWDFVKDEIDAICQATHNHGAILKVIFENDYLPSDDIKIKLCEICTEVGADFVKTSTGYGFVKGSDGKYAYQGATHADLRLMRQHSGENVEVKAAGGVRTLEDLEAVKALGVTRVGATATVAMIEAAKKKYGMAPGTIVDNSDVSGY